MFILYHVISDNAILFRRFAELLLTYCGAVCHKYNGMDELYKLIPDYCAPIKARLNPERLSEVRVINNAPVRVQYDGAYYFLGSGGITKDKSAAFTAERGAAERVVMRACERSLYTVTDTLKRGYVSVSGGIRVGVCGNGVMSDGALNAVKDFSSVNIRIPHEIKGCAAGLLAKIAAGGALRNTLILSPPGGGKTTVLRDLCRLISDHGYCVLLCDEKHEIASVINGVPTLDVGCRTDVISGTDKARVFSFGIANMRPDVIITDELFERDTESVLHASSCGVTVIATVHAKNIDDLRKKPHFKALLSCGVWDCAVTLFGPPSRSMSVSEVRA